MAKPNENIPSPARQQTTTAPQNPPTATAVSPPSSAAALPEQKPFAPASPAPGVVLLHVHTSDSIATHIVEQSTTTRLRSRFGKGPGFEKWLIQQLRNLLVSA